jgi:RNA polymerase sigma-70 factor, ECF subfamily
MTPRFTASAALPVLGSQSSTGRAEPLEDVVVTLFNHFRDPLLRYLSTFSLEFSDSEDILQEVFFSLFQHLRQDKSRENLRGWLFRVAHNLALKRRYRTRHNSENRAVPGAEELAVDPALNPEDRLISGQTQQLVLEVVQRLPEQDRRCLSLRAEGLRYREIAEVLEISLGAVSLSLARSLARIARCVER